LADQKKKMMLDLAKVVYLNKMNIVDCVEMTLPFQST